MGGADGGTGSRTLAALGLTTGERDALAAVLAGHGWRLLDVAGPSRGDLLEAAEAEPHAWLVVPGAGQLAGGLVEAVLGLQEETVVLVGSRSPADDELFPVLRAGAAAYLPWPPRLERFGHVMDSVMQGEVALPRSMASRLARAFRRSPGRQVRNAAGRVVDLSPREAQVLHLLRAGWSTREIGRRMHVADVTVRTHVSALCRKLRVPNRQAVLDLLEQEAGPEGSPGPGVSPPVAGDGATGDGSSHPEL